MNCALFAFQKKMDEARFSRGDKNKGLLTTYCKLRIVISKHISIRLGFISGYTLSIK